MTTILIAAVMLNSHDNIGQHEKNVSPDRSPLTWHLSDLNEAQVYRMNADIAAANGLILQQNVSDARQKLEYWQAYAGQYRPLCYAFFDLALESQNVQDRSTAQVALSDLKKYAPVVAFRTVDEVRECYLLLYGQSFDDGFDLTNWNTWSHDAFVNNVDIRFLLYRSENTVLSDLSVIVAAMYADKPRLAERALERSMSVVQKMKKSQSYQSLFYMSGRVSEWNSNKVRAIQHYKEATRGSDTYIKSRAEQAIARLSSN